MERTLRLHQITVPTNSSLEKAKRHEESGPSNCPGSPKREVRDPRKWTTGTCCHGSGEKRNKTSEPIPILLTPWISFNVHLLSQSSRHMLLADKRSCTESSHPAVSYPLPGVIGPKLRTFWHSVLMYREKRKATETFLS